MELGTWESNGMKVATFNANSIRSRLPILCDWLRCISPMWWVFKRQKFRMKIFLRRRFPIWGIMSRSAVRNHIMA